MPTAKPRLSVVLEQHDFDALARLAKLQGRPLSAVARDFLAECSPVFEQISNALEALLSVSEAAPKELVQRLEKAHNDAAPVLADLMASLREVQHLRDV